MGTSVEDGWRESSRTLRCAPEPRSPGQSKAAPARDDLRCGAFVVLVMCVHGGDLCGEPMILTARGRNNVPSYACRAVKAGKGKGYCDNTTAVPRAELETAVIASLRKTFSAESFREP